MEFFGTKQIKIVINPAESEAAFALKNAIHAKVKLPKLDLSGVRTSVFESVKDLDIEDFATTVVETMLVVDADKAVNEALLACLAKCTYNSEKITMRTFDSVDARKDYYRIVRECIKVNIIPFYEGLISELKQGLELIVKKVAENSPNS